MECRASKSYPGTPKRRGFQKEVPPKHGRICGGCLGSVICSGVFIHDCCQLENSALAVADLMFAGSGRGFPYPSPFQSSRGPANVVRGTVRRSSLIHCDLFGSVKENVVRVVCRYTTVWRVPFRMSPSQRACQIAFPLDFHKQLELTT